MTPADVQEFGNALAALAEIHGREISDPLTDLYFQALSAWPIEAVRKAMSVSAREDRFWPKPVDLIERLGGGSARLEERAAIAWTEVDAAMKRFGQYETVSFEDPFIAGAIEAMGGWLDLFEATEREWPFRGKQFERLYASFVKVGRRGPDRLIGLHEQTNGTRREPCLFRATTPLPAIAYGDQKQLHE